VSWWLYCVREIQHLLLYAVTHSGPALYPAPFIVNNTRGKNGARSIGTSLLFSRTNVILGGGTESRDGLP
jgi:hypothetical protein